jgi:hypothetical protein
MLGLIFFLCFCLFSDWFVATCYIVLLFVLFVYVSLFIEFVLVCCLPFAFGGEGCLVLVCGFNYVSDSSFEYCDFCSCDF